MDDVFVVECAATGPKGFPIDRVVEVAVCRMHRDGNDFDTVYGSFVFADPLDIGKVSLDYLQEEYGIQAEMLYAAPEQETIIKELRSKISGGECTSFNVNQTFGKFLCMEPWDMNMEVTLLPSIASRIPPEYSKSLPDAYNALAKDDSMGITGKTAMDRCLMSTAIMMRLRRDGYL